MSELSALGHALLAAASYEKPNLVDGVGPIAAWELISHQDLAEELFDDENAMQLPFQEAWGNGFFANAYMDPDGGEIVIAFRGTDSIVDFPTQNFPFGLPGTGEQLLFAYFFVEAVKAFAAANNKTISFTGHSLGGGLASIFAIRENAEAVVFAPSISRNELTETLDGFEEIIATADINFNPADLPEGLATFEEATPGVPSGINTRVTVPPLSIVPFANAETFIASREGNVRSFTIDGEILSAIGIGADVGTAQETFIDIGDFDLPAGAVERALRQSLGPVLGLIGKANEAVSLHSIELHVLLMTLGSPEAGDFPLAQLARDLPEFLPTLHDKRVVGNIEHDVGKTLVRELVHAHLSGNQTLSVFHSDLQTLIQGGVAGDVDEIRKSLVQSILQHADAKLRFVGTGIDIDASALEQGSNSVLFDFSKFTPLGVDRSEIVGLPFLEDLRDDLIDDLDTADIDKDIPIVDIDAFGVQIGADGATITGLATQSNFLIGSQGSDTLTGGSQSDYLFGGLADEGLDGGQDILDGGAGDDVLVGGADRDMLDGGTGDDFLFGGADRDILRGGMGADVIEGGEGNDDIHGGDDTEADELTGGEGGDRFFVKGNDIIKDLEKADRVFFDDEQLRGAEENPDHADDPDIPKYKGDLGEVYTLTGSSTISIELPGGLGTIVIEEFRNGDGGIRLDPPAPEDDEPGEGGGEDPSPKGSPLVFDLDGDGFDVTSLETSGAFFDLDRDGFAERTGWIGADDGFLALDRNGDGRINDVSELFGAGIVSPSVSINAGLIPDRSGFTVLSDLDDNGDGVFDANDAAFQDVVIWRDLNENGQSSESELFSLADFNITNIDLDAFRVLQDIEGNTLTDLSTFTRADGSTGEIGDIWFAFDPNDTQELDAIVPTDPEIAALPFLSGEGEVSDLDVAMARDPLLKEMVQDLANLTVADAHLFAKKTEAVIFRWFGVEDFSQFSRGGFADGRHVAAVEKVLGFDFLQGGTTRSPRPQAGAIMARNWRNIHSKLSAQLLAQIPLGQDFVPGMNFELGAFFNFATAPDLSAVLDVMTLNAPADITEKIQYWHGMSRILTGLRREFPSTFDDFKSQIDAALLADGIDLSFDQIRNAFIGDEGDDFLLGRGSSPDGFQILNDQLVGGEDVLMGGAGSDDLRGGAGADTYLFGRGHGQDIISESAFGIAALYPQTSTGDAVKFLAGINLSDVRFSRGGQLLRDLVIEIIGTDDLLTVRNQFATAAPKISSFEFDDGTVLSAFEVADIVTSPSDGDDLLYAQFDENKVFEGGLGNDTLVGDLGSETYIFNRGDGQDTIFERNRDVFSNDIIEFGTGIVLADLTFERSADAEGNDLIIKIASTEDQITVKDQFSRAISQIESLRFADGSTFSDTDIEAVLLTGTDGNDDITGTVRDDTLNGGAGHDLLMGGTGDDVYVFELGGGRDEVRDTEGANVIRFGAGISEDDLIVSRSGDRLRDLTVQIRDTEDTLVLKGQAEVRNISSVEFADGTTISGVDLALLATPISGTDPVGTGDRDLLEGDAGDNRLDGGADVDILKGGAGNDTYVFGRGYGIDVVSDTSGVDIIELLPGVSPDDVEVISSDTIDILGTEDRISFSGIEEVRFANGTVWTSDHLQNGLLTSTDGDDILFSFGFTGQTFDGGTGNDRLFGTSENDTYIFDIGYGTDTIFDFRNGREDPSSSKRDTIQFGASILSTDVTFSREGRDLIVSLNDTDDKLVIRGQYNRFRSAHRIEDFRFGNGTVVSHATIAAQLFVPTDGDDFLLGNDNDNILGGDAGNDILDGDRGNDTYIFGRGSGNDIVQDSRPGSVDQDRIEFTGLNLGDLTVSRSTGIEGFKFTINDTGETLIVAVPFATFLGSRSETFHFADSTVLGTQEIEQLLVDQERTDGNDTILSFGDMVIDAGGGDDTIVLTRFQDTIKFGRDSGHDVIVPVEKFRGSESIIELAADINPSDVTVRRLIGTIEGINGNHLQLSIAGSDATLTVVAQFDKQEVDDSNSPTSSSIDEVRFADGTVWNELTLIDMSLNAPVTDGDDVILGDDSDQIIAGGKGNDILDGGEGNDIYVFNLGDGHDRIHEQLFVSENNNQQNQNDLGVNDISFGAGILSADISARWSGSELNDLTLEVISSNDSLTIVNLANFTAVRNLLFADGSSVPISDIIAELNTATSGDDILVGQSGDDLLDGGAGNDVLAGHEGDDTYQFSLGSGQDLIIDTNIIVAFSADDEFSRSTDALTFGAGILPTDLTFLRSGDALNDLVIKINGTDDQVTIKQQFDPGKEIRSGFAFSENDPDFFPLHGIEEFHFSDGTVLTRRQVFDLAVDVDMSGDNEVTTSDDGGVLNGGGGMDMLLGGAGNDIYIFDRGFSEDMIRDAGGFDTVQFGDGVFPGEVVFNRVGENGEDLLLEVAGEERLTLTFEGQFGDPVNRVERFEFFDGSVLEWPDLQSIMLSDLSTPDDDTILGFDTDDTITGGAGADVITGGKGDDRIFGGEGRDEALFSGNQSDYTIVIDGDRVTVTDLRPDGDGEDVLFGIEKLRFAGDGSTFDLMPDNVAPTAADDTASGNEDTDIIILTSDLLANDTDPEGLPLTLTSVGNAVNGMVFINLAGNITFRPDTDFAGDASFDYMVADIDAATSTASVTVTVNNINDAPVGEDAALSTDEDMPLEGTVTATDVDQDDLSFALAANSANGDVVLDTDTGAFTYTPDANFNGADSFAVDVADGFGGTDQVTLSVTINPVNDAPVAVDDNLTTDKDTALAGSVAASDVDNDPLFYGLSLASTNGDVELNSETGAFTYTPDAGFTGSDSFDVVVDDGNGGIDFATISVTVEDGGPDPIVIIGTNGRDTIDVSDQSVPHHIEGRGDHDTIRGSSAGDIIIGGFGEDNLFGNAGDDTFFVSGNEAFSSTFGGIDDFSGGDGFDRIEATSDNTIIGIQGNLTDIEEISAGGHSGVVVRGSTLTQTLDFSNTNLIGIDHIDGWRGHSTIIGSSGDDTIIGGTGADNLFGGAGDDTFIVELGHGHSSTFGGSDEFYGGDGFDRVVAAEDNVIIGIQGSFINDVEEITADGHAGVIIRGSSQSQTLDFSNTMITGINQFEGWSGHDTIIGTSNSDIIIGGSGEDNLFGGGGNDTFLVASTHGSSGNFGGSDEYDGGDGFDRIVATANDTIIGFQQSFNGNVEEITADGHTGVVIRGSSLSQTLDFSGTTIMGITFFDGWGGHDTIIGTANDDEIRGGGGNDTLNGGDGSDTAIYSGVFADFSVVQLGASISVTDNNTTDGDHGHDTLSNIEFIQFDDQTVNLASFSQMMSFQSQMQRFGALGGECRLFFGNSRLPFFETQPFQPSKPDQATFDNISSSQISFSRDGDNLVLGADVSGGNEETVLEDWYTGNKLHSMKFSDGVTFTADQIDALANISSDSEDGNTFGAQIFDLQRVEIGFDDPGFFSAQFVHERSLGPISDDRVFDRTRRGRSYNDIERKSQRSAAAPASVFETKTATSVHQLVQAMAAFQPIGAGTLDLNDRQFIADRSQFMAVPAHFE